MQAMQALLATYLSGLRERLLELEVLISQSLPLGAQAVHRLLRLGRGGLVGGGGCSRCASSLLLRLQYVKTEKIARE